MTNIFCSNKLKEFIGESKITSNSIVNDNPFGDWNAHIFLSERKKHLIFVNNKSYYSIFIPDIRKADCKNLDMLFLGRLMSHLAYDKIIDLTDAQKIEKMILPIVFVRTNNDRKTIGTMNDCIFQYEGCLINPYFANTEIEGINHSIARIPVGAGRNEHRDYGDPIVDTRRLFLSKLEFL